MRTGSSFVTLFLPYIYTKLQYEKEVIVTHKVSLPVIRTYDESG